MRFVLLALLALVMVIAPAATATRAQGADCLPGLDADTCALFSAASANQATINKFVMDYEIALKTSGLPDPNNIDLSVKGNGPIDVSALAAMAMSMATPDPAMMADPSAIIKSLVMAQTMDASLSAGGQDLKGTFEFRIVEGVLYFKGDMATQDMWMKVDLLQAVASASGQLSALQGQMGGAATGALDPALTEKAMALFADTSKFFSTEVGEGGEVEGVKTTSVTLNVNIKALVEALFSEDGRALILEAAKAQGQALTEQDLAQISAILPLLEKTLDATKLSISWWIDPDAKQFRGFAMNFSTVVDEGLATLANPQSTTPPTAISVDFSFAVTLSKLGEDVVVEPVADAQEVPLNN
jgi:hypothetical protein